MTAASADGKPVLAEWSISCLECREQWSSPTEPDAYYDMYVHIFTSIDHYRATSCAFYASVDKKAAGGVLVERGHMTEQEIARLAELDKEIA